MFISFKMLAILSTFHFCMDFTIILSFSTKNPPEILSGMLNLRPIQRELIS